jgi:hypothetical protein
VIDNALFDLPPDAVTQLLRQADLKLQSLDRKRTARILAELAAGVHPLRKLPLHPQAAPVHDRKAKGLRCGGCRHFGPAPWRTEGTYFKCHADDGAYLTGSVASDARAWWPGCREWELPDAPPG